MGMIFTWQALRRIGLPQSAWPLYPAFISPASREIHKYAFLMVEWQLLLKYLKSDRQYILLLQSLIQPKQAEAHHLVSAREKYAQWYFGGCHLAH